jgi:hypothetical protein
MRRLSRFLPLLAVIALAAGLAWIGNSLLAQPEQAKPGKNLAAVVPKNLGGVAAAEAQSQLLPITHVSLYTSGIGFFQREGQVDGTAHIDLTFPIEDVNDLLKSLVLRDLGGGQIRAVGYDSKDPVEKALHGYVIDLSGNPSYGQILNQARGEKVELTWLAAEAKVASTVAGTIVGVEKQRIPLKEPGIAEREFLNLWSEKGLQSIQLAEITQIRFLNTFINSEVEQALAVVSQSRDVQQKTVRFYFAGKGKREVQIGYVVEHPVWKTSYRLVLDTKGKAYLQGWAIVENPTNEDWNDVNVSLISGRPVSFKMNLYEPLYVDRPLVELERFANLRPRIYEGDLEETGKVDALKERQQAEQKKGLPSPAAPGFARSAKSDMAMDKGFAGEAFQSTTQAVAQGGKLGDQFQYIIEHPVSLPRQKSAMLPIVNKDIGGIRVSIFNEKNLPTHPMLGLKLKNTTDLHLMQGPITVLDQGGYAGDALLDDLQPGEERLLSYAVDLGTEIKTESKPQAEQVVNLSIVKGIAHKTIVYRQTKNYVVKNRSDTERLVILEHPDQSPAYALVQPEKAPAKSRSFYRFELAVPAGATQQFPVVEERAMLEEIVLSNVDSRTMLLLVQSPAASPELKTALEKAIALKNQLAETQQKISDLQARITTISQDQQRQRDNMKVIPQTDPVYKKYLDKFLKQEEQIDTMRGQIEQLQVTANEQRQAYEAFLLNLNVGGKKT